MFKKRSNDNSQLRPDEVDNLDNEDPEEPGAFQRASATELAGRKIVKIKRSSAASSEPPVALVPSSTASNPFATFQGFTSSNSSTSVPPPPSNPFASFNALTASTSIVTPQGFSLSHSSTIDNSNRVEISHVSNSANNVHHDSKCLSETEYQKKVKKLNQSFLNWSDRQIKENAIAVWKDGVKDYIKYQKSLRERFPLQLHHKKEETAQPGLIIPAGSTLAAAAKSLEKAPTSVPPKLDHAPALNTFNFPSAPPTSTPSFNFTLGSGASNSVASSFNFSNSSNSFSFPTSSAGFGTITHSSIPVVKKSDEGGDGGDDEGDDEGEPILEPEKILRNENDKDEILLEVTCKLLGYSKELSEWRDKGKGSFRLTKDPLTSKKRMLVRNTMGKITFNAAFFKGMKVDRHKDSLLFSAFVSPDESSKPDFQRFTLKLKADDCEKVKLALEKCISEI